MDMSKKVYHYCSVDTFYSIISNQTFRLSDITKSNDYLEISWIKNSLYAIFENLYSMLAEGVRKELSKEEYIKRINEKIELYFDKSELTERFYVICFSGEKSGDLLSQWRGYGNDGRGIAIEINEIILNQLADSLHIYGEDKSKVLYRKVEYDKERQERKILETIKRFFNQINNRDTYEIPHLKSQFEIVLLRCFTELYQEAIFMKNPFFQEENESRLVICIGENRGTVAGRKIKELATISEKAFYVRNNELISYYDLDFKQGKEGISKIISGCILGPKCGVDEKTLRSFLKAQGIYYIKEDFCKKSEGSYR